jgi:hypothetical protein
LHGFPTRRRRCIPPCGIAEPERFIELISADTPTPKRGTPGRKATHCYEDGDKQDDYCDELFPKIATRHPGLRPLHPQYADVIADRYGADGGAREQPSE